MNASFTPQTDNSPLRERWLSQSGRLFTIAWLIIGGGSLGAGWYLRDEGYLSADSGIGYWLGIIGGCGMLLLLTYSMRKRMKLLRRALPIKLWFQLHMTLGIVGPLCILFHSNFHLGSLNSTVAMVCMLLVAGSGIIGRYIYNRIHFGLYGERIRLREAVADFQTLQQELAALACTTKQRTQCDNLFDSFEDFVARRERNSGLSYWRDRREVQAFGKSLQRFIASLDMENRQRPGTAEQLDRMHQRIQQDHAILMAILRKLPSLQLYERLFSLWHVIHIPIFVLMIITAVIHVVVVHMY